MRRLLLVVVLGLSLGLNAVAIARWLASGDGTEAPRAAWEQGCPIPRLNLTDEERAAIAPIRERFHAERLAQRSRLLQLRTRLASLVVSDSPDQAAIAALLDEMSAAQADLQRKVVERVLAIRGVLGPEQRARYDEMIVPHIQAGAAMRCDCEGTEP